MELQIDRKIKILRSVNEREYKSDLFRSCTVMKALSDTSQLEKLRNRMG